MMQFLRRLFRRRPQQIEATVDLSTLATALGDIGRGVSRLVALAEQENFDRRVEVEWQYMVDKYGPEIGHPTKALGTRAVNEDLRRSREELSEINRALREMNKASKAAERRGRS